MFSLHFACARRKSRTLGNSRAWSISVLAYCLGVVALFGGYTAHASTADPLSISSSITTCGVAPVAQTAASRSNLRMENCETMDVPQPDSFWQKPIVDSVNRAVRIRASGESPSGIGVRKDPVASYSSELIAANRTEELIPQFVHGRGIVMSAFSCSSASVTGAGSDNCTVTLSAPAWSSMAAKLASNNAAVSVPATLVIPAKATSVAFTAHVQSVTSAQTVTLQASLNGTSRSFVLGLNAAAATVPTLSVSPSSVVFGNVALNTATTQPVTLSSTGTGPVTINSAKLSGTGFAISGVAFPVTLNPSLAVTVEVQFDPTTAGAAVGQLTIQSNSSTNSTVAVSLTGTGEAAQHHVNLSWSAPASSPVPIAGYYIYRSTGGSTSYQLLNSTADTQTTYVDSTVLAGSTYDYIVESVGSSGTESVPSNEVGASVP